MDYDCTTAIGRGRRDYQEDAISADFNIGNAYGFVVLADGMGGHASGNAASKIIVTEVFSELKFQFGDALGFERDVAGSLRDAVRSANDCITSHVLANPETRGMGATVLAVVVFENRMHWISVGDSPLFLVRGGKLERLNEDHSMAPQIDAMVKLGQIDAETAKHHPGRSALTSVLIGSSITRIDCRSAPLELKPGDIVLAASDGVLYLEEKKIAAIVAKNAKRPSAEIAEAILSAIAEADHPEQDNVSFSVIRYM